MLLSSCDLDEQSRDDRVNSYRVNKVMIVLEPAGQLSPVFVRWNGHVTVFTEERENEFRSFSDCIFRQGDQR